MGWGRWISTRSKRTASTLPVALALGATQAGKGTSSGSLSTFLGEGAGRQGQTAVKLSEVLQKGTFAKSPAIKF